MLWSRWREKCTWAEGTGRVLWQQSGAEELRRRKQLRQFLATGVIAYHSDLCSHHCRLCPVLLALLPAWTDSGVISCQDTKAFAMMPLQTICLARADHQHGLRDLRRSLTLLLPPHLATGRINPPRYLKFTSACEFYYAIVFC